MEWGHLSKYFRGVGAKRLAAVEIDPGSSHQHEFQGIQAFRAALGGERLEVPATVLWLPDDEDDHQQVNGDLTWYDARENQPNRTPEFRLYYRAPADSVVHNAAAGDLLVLGLTTGGRAIIAIAPAGSTNERQLLWLFGLPQELERATALPTDKLTDIELTVTGSAILEALGVETEASGPSHVDVLIDHFGGEFPSTREMSEFARSLTDVDPRDDPDAALIAWYAQEEVLFKGLERHLVQQQLDKGFNDVEEFLSESLRVHQRRKSRAGYALENQLEAVLQAHEIAYTRGPITERKSRPDFVFPGIDQYRDGAFPAAKLSMLAAKSTCKERWRQILPEADRIEHKHLLTLEPAISPDQTTEITRNHVHLVLPEEIHSTYLRAQRGDLMTVGDFLSLVQSRP